MNNWQPWSLRELVGDLTTGATTPAEALQRSRARIAETDPELRAWVELGAPASANGPLGGVPLAVKDIVDVAGLPTRCGSQLRADAPPAAADAAIVTAWRNAGAIPVGKSVTTEFAYFAPGPTRNPAAPEHTPGGSSSGSAAAVAAGQVPLALGSQTAGSVTRPAAFCGVASLVLTRGRFSVEGVTGLSPSLDSHGFFAAGASDLALAWSALTGEPDSGLATGRPPRLLLWTPQALEPPMATALTSACAKLRAAGAVIDEFPDGRLIAQLTAAHPVIMAYEAARERAVELAAASQLSEQLATLLRTGAATSEHDYETARRTTTEAGERLSELLADYDAVLGPAALGPAPAGITATGDPVLSRPWQALGLPALCVPGMRTEAGLPLGLQLVGAALSETELLATACWSEAALRA
ncbi:Asp-tRNAAsn/Glu-tRNAGln amidotransferase A subunit [Saccharopolyspora antimicrobica]|uniref:Asp-tRNA(Asn)/Glu-tRNA(Gln) amidotransferase A subunit family amidase n=1 Tax=Saccharopolyspora antimicrobica TaxID=455193 RepID=A0A1I5K4R8_9PSEU|nr:amidase [Saccharopolyspora antimicrobica]RKT84800.1 Asp-tRNA(Asn)/Glu-tRNA(Gln) amidotransferase A subunit family amidase [Saccharopolyspora antimicrobica]SFO80045.1 Asp-tRNAAsn/Glu-tRNAGln amidotransferase A subunit [Saccharopolyspora antimicrobica]